MIKFFDQLKPKLCLCITLHVRVKRPPYVNLHALNCCSQNGNERIIEYGKYLKVENSLFWNSLSKGSYHRSVLAKYEQQGLAAPRSRRVAQGSACCPAAWPPARSSGLCSLDTSCMWAVSPHIKLFWLAQIF